MIATKYVVDNQCKCSSVAASRSHFCARRNTNMTPSRILTMDMFDIVILLEGGGP